jgi:hypothetical protein
VASDAGGGARREVAYLGGPGAGAARQAGFAASGLRSGRPGGGPAQWWKNNELKDPRVNAINRKYRFKNSAGYRDTFSWIAVSSKIFRMESIEPKELETFIYDTIVTNYIEPFNALVDLFDVVFKKEEVAAE